MEYQEHIHNMSHQQQGNVLSHQQEMEKLSEVSMNHLHQQQQYASIPVGSVIMNGHSGNLPRDAVMMGSDTQQQQISSSSSQSSSTGTTAGAVQNGMPSSHLNGMINQPVSAISSLAQKSHRDDYHSFLVASSKFTVNKRYNLNKVIGHGAYGIVVSATDSILQQDVAIKKVPHAFNDLIDAKRILREIKLLMHFKHQNTIGMKDIMCPLAPIDQYEEVYLVTDLMETDLHRIIYSRQPLTDDHVQYFIYQILCALKYMHSAGVLHRDLKPSNLLLNSNCDLKVCDFGLARGVNDEQVDLTEYVVTRWYRAPEIMLSCKKYTFAIDVWSTGCIMAELLGRKPVFPGDDYIHQLQIINEILGSPTEADLSFVTSEKAKRFMLGLPKKERVPLNILYPHANPLAIDLLQKMLMFDPAKRISVNEALRHPYLETMVNEEEETICPEPFIFDYEGIKLDKPMLQELIWEQMVSSFLFLYTFQLIR